MSTFLIKIPIFLSSPVTTKIQEKPTLLPLEFHIPFLLFLNVSTMFLKQWAADLLHERTTGLGSLKEKPQNLC